MKLVHRLSHCLAAVVATVLLFQGSLAVPPLDRAQRVAASPSSQVRPCSPGLPPADPGSDYPRTVALSAHPLIALLAPHNQRLFVLHSGEYDARVAQLKCAGSLTMYDAASDQALVHVNLKGNPIAEALDGVRGRLIVATQGGQDSHYRGFVYVLDTRRASVLHTTALPQQPIALAVDTRAGRVAVAMNHWRSPGATDQVETLKSATGTRVASVPISNVRALAVSSRTATLFVAGGSGIVLLDSKSGTRLYPIPLRNGAPRQLGIDDAANRLIAVSGGDSHGGRGAALFIEVATGQILHTITYPTARGAEAVVVDPAAGRALIGEASAGPATDPDTAVFDTTTAWLQARSQVQIQSVAVDPTTGYLYAPQDGGTVAIIDPRDWRQLREISVGGDVGRLLVLHTPDRLAVLHPRAMTMTVYCLQAQC